jgi:hypothetical protein
MMVIVYMYKEVNYFKYKQQGKVTFMPQITFLILLYNLCTKEFVFPIFPLLVNLVFNLDSTNYSSKLAQQFPLVLMTRNTPLDSKQLVCTTEIICTQLKAFLASI